MIIAVDLDGTILEERRTFERALAKLLPGKIEILRKLRQEGHTIVIYTARSYCEYEMTKKQLVDLNVPHDLLVMGKFPADVYIDDRAHNTLESLEDVLLKERK